jgi:hypothetical protein
MQRLILGLVVAAIAAATPAVSIASEADRQKAHEIANALRQSGELNGYKVGVKYTDGTAWLEGRVGDQTQLNSVLDVVKKTPGLRKIVNRLAIGPEAPRARLVSRAQAIPSTAAVPRAGHRGGPRPVAYSALAPAQAGRAPGGNQPIPAYTAQPGRGAAQARFDKPHLPGYAWPGYASHPNYSALTYPKQYSPTAWPYIGPFYPYPQVPLGWRKVTLEWDDGWWMLDFKNK